MSNDLHNDQPHGQLADRVRSLKLPPTVTAQKPSWRGALPWLLCLVLAAVCVYLGAQLRTTGPEAGNADMPTRPAGSQQPTAPGGVVLEAGGYIIPVSQVTVSPEVGGKVVELLFKEGDRVKKGQVLARLKREEYEFAYRRAQALADQMKARYDEMVAGAREEEKKQAEAAWKEAQALLQQAQDEFNRLRQAGRATTPDELVKAESRLIQARYKVAQLEQAHLLMQKKYRDEQIAAAKAELEQAEAQRDRAKYDLDNTEVRAPIAGVILVKPKGVEVGGTIQPQAFNLSASLCEMADLTNLEVDIDISERDLKRVWQGQRCRVRTEAFPDVTYDGVVSRLMPVANRSKASVSVRVKIIVPEDDTILRPEMRARVQFLAKDEKK
jgi:HlyD family secretion protein